MENTEAKLSPEMIRKIKGMARFSMEECKAQGTCMVDYKGNRYTTTEELENYLLKEFERSLFMESE